jgi:hypothetical protein
MIRSLTATQQCYPCHHSGTHLVFTEATRMPPGAVTVTVYQSGVGAPFSTGAVHDRLTAHPSTGLAVTKGTGPGGPAVLLPGCTGADMAEGALHACWLQQETVNT